MPNYSKRIDELFPNLRAWHDKDGDLHTIAEAKQALLSLLLEAEVAGRIDELNRKMTLNLELLSSADFKAGFREALNQVDCASDVRIEALKTNQEKK